LNIKRYKDLKRLREALASLEPPDIIEQMKASEFCSLYKSNQIDLANIIAKGDKSATCHFRHKHIH
jgi:hypothetical protein